MELIDGKLVISPRDLISEIECSTRLNLDWAVAMDLLKAPPKEFSPELELLMRLGEIHEDDISQKLREKGTFKEIGKPTFTINSLKVASRQTSEAINMGIDVIAQATLFTGDFLGFADFLLLEKDNAGNPIKDSAGRFIYNPVDAKSARSAKRSAVLQVASYASALVDLGFATPNKVVLLLGGDKQWEALATDVLDLAREFIFRVKDRISLFSKDTITQWDAPREACTRCRWENNCIEARELNKDLSLIQGIRSTTRTLLLNSGIKTIDQLAVATDEMRPIKPNEVSRETFDNLRAQAKIQIEGRGLQKPKWQIKEPIALGLLPESNYGDIWFDMEGDPFALNGDGLEYMFGYTYLADEKDSKKLSFNTFDAINREEEKVAFVNFISFILNRREIYPEMHIYHYAAYEPSAMLKLALRHGVYELEVDQLIREGVFVDLYSIVRKAFRFSTESLSIKQIEQVYQEKRDKEKGVSTAVDSVIQFEAALAYLSNNNTDKFKEIYRQIRDYNKDDTDSTYYLDLWLREVATNSGIDIASIRPIARARFVDVEEESIEPVAVQLLKDIPTDPEKRDSLQTAISLLANSIYFHRREKRPAWRNIFERANAELEDLQNYNDVVVVTSASASDWSIQGKQRKHRRTTTVRSEGLDIGQILELDQTPLALYENAQAGFKTMQGSTRGMCSVAGINRIDGDLIEFQEREITEPWFDLPIALLPQEPLRTNNIESVLRDYLGQGTLARKQQGLYPFPEIAWSDILLKRPPRQRSGSLTRTDDNINDIVESLIDSDNSYVAVQGPPGTGKTYVGSHVITKLVKKGWRIGVVAQSHAVIENMLDGVYELDKNVPIAKRSQATARKSYHVSDLGEWMYLQDGGYVVGGTIWSFSAPSVRLHELDLMVIDEAGQFALANALVALSVARCGLLLGDPQQLPQVSQAAHPEPVQVSVLGHILGDHATIPPNLGYFLEETYRMHPKLAKPVSILQYEGKLRSAEICSKRNLQSVEAGLHIVNVNHEGNTTSSQEEADQILLILKDVLGKSWIDVKNNAQLEARTLNQEDILVVTAYNMQVRKIKKLLEVNGLGRVRVGTFDKFQGQEAPVVFVSMSTSSREDLPRGIDFLLSPNRLNVAISRAQWACYLVRSPQLSFMEPNSPEGMVQLGKFITLCKVRDEDK